MSGARCAVFLAVMTMASVACSPTEQPSLDHHVDCTRPSDEGLQCGPTSACKQGICKQIDCTSPSDEGLQCGRASACEHGICELCAPGIAPGTDCSTIDPYTGKPIYYEVCSTKGFCDYCWPGEPCQSDENPCLIGVHNCSQGATCENLTPASDGTVCGPFSDYVCRGGVCKTEFCELPDGGSACAPETDCQIDSCYSIGGSHSCSGLHPKPDGTPCGNPGQTCQGGACH